MKEYDTLGGQNILLPILHILRIYDPVILNNFRYKTAQIFSMSSNQGLYTN